jgi:hypothetical protein
MNRRIPFNPFEDLHDFSELKTLTSHILHSLEVKEVKVRMPWGFNAGLHRSPLLPLSVQDILVGDATFGYIKHRAEYVLKNVANRIEKVNGDGSMSFTDKSQLFSDVRKDIAFQYQYFDSMNPVRYMSSYTWKIVYSEAHNGQTVEKEEPCVNSELDLKEWHWNVIENTLLIRRHLLYEILHLVDVELQKIQDRLAETRYVWESKEPYEIYELLLAILASNRVKIEKGDESTFAHDFLAFFHVSEKKLAYSRDKVLKRLKRSQFIPVLEDSLELFGKSSKKSNKK